MSRTVTVKEAERDLRHILESLSPGDRITVVDETGAPLGEMHSSSNPSPSSSADQRKELDTWMKEMKELARQIDEGWIGEKSGLQQLQEDRSRLDPKSPSQDGPDSSSTTG